MTGYYDYLVILSPSESVTSRVKKLKSFCGGKIGEFDSSYSKAHISVQYWPRKKPLWVEPLIAKLERELQLFPAAPLEVDGFDFFDHNTGKTIYAKLKSSVLTHVWFKQLRRYFNTRDFVPHITIAKGITNDAFNTLWPGFKNIEWGEGFVADKLVILKRPTIGYDQSYKVIKEIYFNQKLDFNAFASSKIRKPVLSSDRLRTQQISLF